MLEATNVSVNFGALSALTGVDLRVGPGEIVALSGEPGAGKTALVRCLTADLAPTSGRITVGGQPLAGSLRGAERQGVAAVWQEIALCDTLDVAGNLLLGHERLRDFLLPSSLYERAAGLLTELEIPITDTTVAVSELTGAQRRLLTIAAALIRKPRLLVLDEPTVVLGAAEAADVERLLLRAQANGAAILLASRDVNQMFRIASRIVALRRGRVVAEFRPQDSHPDDLATVLAGGTVDGSARRQLIRLHGLADNLALAEPSSGLALIISALAAALGVDRSDIDVARVDASTVPSSRVIIEDRTWLVPVVGPGGSIAVLSVRRENDEPPNRDETDLLGLYAGYAAAAIERQDAEISQREAAALRHSRELQREFLSRLSHELRTPLTAIRGYASSLLAPDIAWDEDSEQRFLERIAAESSRLGRLVDDLLDFSAIESGVMRMQRDWCELGLVIEAAVACLPGDWPDAVEVAGATPMPVIWADHDRLEQVFVNLLGNALHHNPAGTRVTVSVTLGPGDSVEISVEDDGPGLPNALRHSPFDSTDRPRSQTSGAGLGLSITRGIIEAHNGTITVDSNSSGTSFRIVLPVEAPEATLAQANVDV